MLDEQQEVGVRLVSFGREITIHVMALGYVDPSLILFIGQTEEGKPLELIQHVSQISFLLTVLPRLEPEKPRRKIGFVKVEEGTVE